jgi:acetyl/propionyl-CoA carboxylase alpha subunit
LERQSVSRILVANRGEIAVRIIRACRELGIPSVAVYSDADARAPHVFLADDAVRIGPASPAESYLSIAAILDAARKTGADAIHPGYGFLSENAGFASACEQAGITFVGPPAAVIERLGSKIAARAIARQAGVPVVPGETPVDQSTDAVAAAAHRVGFPILVKPSAGGGGIGMKTIRDERALAAGIEQARREATAAFGDGTLYVERLIERPRHVEIQVLADNHGNVLHVFERECSIQRRHQKVIEETPSPALTSSLRQRMGEAAVTLARAAGYRNAGTVEFLLEGTGDGASFYFLEVNTRLQVEHPVTERVTGVDLVHAQIAIAGGERLRRIQGTTICRRQARCCSTANLRCRASGSTPARTKEARSASTTIHWSRSWSPTARRARSREDVRLKRFATIPFLGSGRIFRFSSKSSSIPGSSAATSIRGFSRVKAPTCVPVDPLTFPQKRSS